jgi:hypothetical protein
MSVAGILASSIFSNFGSSASNKTTNISSAVSGGTGSSHQAGNISEGPSPFAVLQQQLSAQSAGLGSLTGPLGQLGQDLNAGKLSAARSDFNNVKLAISQSSFLKSNQGQASGGSSSASSNAAGTSDPLTAALQAYSSLQLNPLTGGLNNSLIANSGTLSVDA